MLLAVRSQLRGPGSTESVARITQQPAYGGPGQSIPPSFHCLSIVGTGRASLHTGFPVGFINHLHKLYEILSIDLRSQTQSLLHCSCELFEPVPASSARLVFAITLVLLIVCFLCELCSGASHFLSATE